MDSHVCCCRFELRQPEGLGRFERATLRGEPEPAYIAIEHLVTVCREHPVYADGVFEGGKPSGVTRRRVSSGGMRPVHGAMCADARWKWLLRHARDGVEQRCRLTRLAGLHERHRFGHRCAEIGIQSLSARDGLSAILPRGIQRLAHATLRAQGEHAGPQRVHANVGFWGAQQLPPQSVDFRELVCAEPPYGVNERKPWLDGVFRGGIDRNMRLAVAPLRTEHATEAVPCSRRAGLPSKPDAGEPLFVIRCNQAGVHFHHSHQSFAGAAVRACP